jgi:hypothetical protein
MPVSAVPPDSLQDDDASMPVCAVLPNSTADSGGSTPVSAGIPDSLEDASRSLPVSAVIPDRREEDPGDSFISIDQTDATIVADGESPIRPIRRPCRFWGPVREPAAESNPAAPGTYIIKSRFLPLVSPKDAHGNAPATCHQFWTSGAYQKAITSHDGRLDITLEISETKSALTAVSADADQLDREVATLSAALTEKLSLSPEWLTSIDIGGVHDVPDDKFREDIMQTDMTNVDVSLIEKETVGHAGSVADSLRLQQEMIAAQSRLPQLQREASDLRSANLVTQQEIHRLDNRGKSQPLPDPQRDFEAIRNEKCTLVTDFEKQIETAETEIEELKNRIEIQRDLQVSLKDQIKRKKRPLRCDPNRLRAELRDTTASHRLQQEELVFVQSESGYYTRRTTDAQSLLAQSKTGLESHVHQLRRKLRFKKRAFRAQNSQTETVTNATELESLQVQVSLFEAQFAVSTRQCAKACERVRKSRHMLKAWVVRVPGSARSLPTRYSSLYVK